MFGIRATLSDVFIFGLVFGLTEADVSCRDPGQVPNAERQGSPGPYPSGNVVHFICKTCYRGGGTITCQSNGQWSQRRECTRVTCPDPGIVTNGYRQGNAPFHCNSVVTFTCNTGFRLHGSTSLHCQIDGTWRGETPACISEGASGSCWDPGHVTNSVRHGPFGSFPVPLGTRITYACDDCFSGGGSITCLGTGGWTTIPTCTHVSCHDPGFIDNGYRDGAAPFICPATVTYSCHPGLYLRGSNHLTCQEDGTWSHERPVCATEGPGEPGRRSGGDDGDDDNSTAILLGIFLPLIFLVLIIILIVILLQRRGIHPLDRIIAWWKGGTGTNDNGPTQQQNNPGNQDSTASGNQGNNASQNPFRSVVAWWKKKDNRQDHQLESNIHNNATSNVTASQNSNAVSNNVYMTEEFASKMGAQGAEAPLSYSSVKKKEFSEPPPSYDLYYENVNAQKGNLKT